MEQINLPENHLTNELFVNGQKHILISEKELEQLVLKTEQLNDEKNLIRWGLFQLLGLLGLTNEAKTEVKPELLIKSEDGGESVLKPLMKKGAELFWLFSQTNMPGSIGRKATEKVKEHFAFVDKLLPLLDTNKTQNEVK